MKKLLLAVFTLASFISNAQYLRNNMTRQYTPYSYPGSEFRVVLYPPLDTMVNADLGAIAYIPNDSTFYIRIPGKWVPVKGANLLIAKNATSKIGDTIIWGGALDRYTHIKNTYNRSDTGQTGFNYVEISNTTPELSGYNWLSANGTNSRPYERALQYLSKEFGDNDTLYKSYGALQSGTTGNRFTAGNKRYLNPATPLLLPYGGAYFIHQLFPPDSANWQTSNFGHTSVYAGDLGIGGSNGFWLNAFSQNNITYRYPINVMRMGIDFARTTSAIKREYSGGPYSIYVADWKSHQAAISGGTTEYGSYIPLAVGFHVYGNIFPHTESPSKVKTLAVSTMDTVVAVLAEGMYTDFNETKNGVGFWSRGTQDDNHFAGRFRLGGNLPLHSTFMRRFHNVGTTELNDTTYITKPLVLTYNSPATAFSGLFNIAADSGIRIGYNYGNRVYMSLAQYQQGITQSNKSSKRNKGLLVETDWDYTDNAINITNDFNRAIQGIALHIAGDSLNTMSANGGMGGNEFGLFLRKRAAFGDTTVFQGGATPDLAAWGLRGTFDLAGNQATSITNANLVRGWHAAIDAWWAWSAWHQIDKAIWLRTGGVQSGGVNSEIKNGYQIYMLPSDSRVTNKNAIFQEGLLDSNTFNGILKTPHLTTGSTSDSVVVVSSGGVIKKVAQSSISGSGTPSLAATEIAYGRGDNVQTSNPRQVIDSATKTLRSPKLQGTNIVKSGDTTHNNKPVLNAYIFGNSIETNKATKIGYLGMAHRLVNYLNMKEVNLAIGGTRMVSLSTGDSAMEERLFLIPTYNSATDGLLVFGYGTNDWRTLSVDSAVYRTKFNATLDYAMVTKGWPANKVLVQTPGYSIHPTPSTQPRNLQFVEITKDLAKKKGVKYSDNYAAMQSIGLNTGLNLVEGDSVHLNEQGNQVCALAAADTLGASNGDGRFNGNVFARQLLIKAYGYDPTITLTDSAGNVFGEIRGWNGNGSFNASLAIGKDAMDSLTSGLNNYSIGQLTFRGLTSGSGNFGGGFNVLNKNKVGNYNVGLGHNALSNWLGSNATAAGAFAMQNATNATNMSAYGYGAFQNSTIAVNGVAIGASAAINNVDGDNLVAVGHNALVGNTSGDHNIGVGQNAGAANQAGSSNIWIGHQAGMTMNGAVGNTIMGRNANRLGSGAIVFNAVYGFGAVEQATSANRLSIFGTIAGKLLTTGVNHSLFGYEALDSVTSSNGFFAAGYQVGYNIKAGHRSILIGYQAGLGATNADSATIIGNFAYPYGTSLSKVVALGDGSIRAQGVRLYSDSTYRVAFGNFAPQEKVHISGKLKIDSIDNDAAPDSLLTVNNGRVDKTSIAALLTSLGIDAADYVPTLTGVNNVDAVTLVAARYFKIKDEVFVDIKLSIDPTTISTPTNVDIDLPFAATITNFTNLSGNITAGDNTAGNINAVGNKARTAFTAVSTSNTLFDIHYSYKITP